MTGAWNKGILAGVIATMAVAGGCATDRQRELEEQNKTLAAACDDLRRQNEALRKEIATLKGDRGIRDAYIKKLEKQNALLEKMLAEMGDIPGTERTAEGGLRLLGDFFFRPGSDGISKEGVSSLRRIAAKVRDNNMHVRVVGHTDNDPINRSKKKYPTLMNLELGAARAVAVAHELKKAGVDEHSISVMSLGESKPIADNGTKDGKRRNRRVDLFFSDAPPTGGR
jgi:chemotaxis protein MotB